MQPTADYPTSALTGGDVDIRPGMVLPLPDDAAAAAARDRLSTVDIGVNAPTIAALGMLAEGVTFIAAVQATAFPRPILSTRVVLLTGSHAGGVVAGHSPDPRNATPLQHLAVTAGAGVVTLEWQPAAAAIELEDAVTAEQMDAALRAGWDEAERAADEGIEVLVLAAGGAGASTAAAAVVAAITGAEPTMLLTRVVTPAGYYDDNAWMTRCLALRDALHRVRQRDGDPRTVLSALGGADLAAATGLILGAAYRRTPVMIDGPVGAAAALLANDFSPQSRSWVVLPDTGRHPAVRLAADALQLRPWLDLCLDLGEGATALAALPLLQTALTLAGAGEAVEPQPFARFDSSGNQVFVGVAKPVDPDEEDDEAESEFFTGSTMENASVLYSSANVADGSPATVAVGREGGAEPDAASAPKSTGAGRYPRTPATRPAHDDTAIVVAKAGAAKTDGAKGDATTGKPGDGKVTGAKAGDGKAAGARTADGKPGDAKAGARAGDAKAGAAGTPDGARGGAAEPGRTDPAKGGPDAARTSADATPTDVAKADTTAPVKQTPAKAAVKPPTRTATKPPPAPRPAGKSALTAKTANARTVPARSASAGSTKDSSAPAGGDPANADTTKADTTKADPTKADATKADTTKGELAPATDAADLTVEVGDEEPTSAVGATTGQSTPPKPRKRT